MADKGELFPQPEAGSKSELAEDRRENVGYGPDVLRSRTRFMHSAVTGGRLGQRRSLRIGVGVVVKNGMVWCPWCSAGPQAACRHAEPDQAKPRAQAEPDAVANAPREPQPSSPAHHRDASTADRLVDLQADVAQLPRTTAQAAFLRTPCQALDKPVAQLCRSRRGPRQSRNESVHATPSRP